MTEGGCSGFASLKGFLVVCLPMISLPVHAITWGIYDARTLGMAGVGMAVANFENAQYYNPALLAWHNGRQEETEDARASIHLLGEYSGPIDAMVDFYDEEFDQVLGDAVDTFNDDQSQQNAALALDALNDLDGVADAFDEDRFRLDTQLGISFSLPSDREGGAFFITGRPLIALNADITDADQNTIDRYREALLFLSTGGAQGSAQPDLFDGDGNLIQPRDNLASTANLGGVFINDIGMALAREYEFFGQRVQLGVTPKIQRIIVLFQQFSFSEEELELNYEDNSDVFYMANLDLGVATTFRDHWRFGLAVQNVFSRSQRVLSGPVYRFEPQFRAGAAYENAWLTLALDMDVLPSEDILGEGANQELAVGAALRPLQWLEFRAGYRTDLESNAPDLATLGVGAHFWHMVGEIGAGFGDDSASAGLRLAWGF